MNCHSSATVREAEPHANETTTNTNISDALRRRTQFLINDLSLDAENRAMLRYGLEINDPLLAQLVRSAEGGEPLIDALARSDISESSNEEEELIEERVTALAEIVCRAGDEPENKSAALFVLMGTIEHSNNPNYSPMRPSISRSPAAASSTCLG